MPCLNSLLGDYAVQLYNQASYRRKEWRNENSPWIAASRFHGLISDAIAGIFYGLRGKFQENYQYIARVNRGFSFSIPIFSTEKPENEKSLHANNGIQAFFSALVK